MSDDDAPYFEAFMLGTGPFMGAHFGDATPVGEKGAFWWRKYFERFAARMNRRTPPPAKTGELREAVATAIRSRRSNPFNPYILADAALTALQPALDAAREEGRREAMARERVFALGAGECVTAWGTYGNEPCVFLGPLVGDPGVQGEVVPDSENAPPGLLRNGSIVLLIKGEPTAFLEDIASAIKEMNANV